MDVQGLLSQVLGSEQQSSVGDAAAEHVNSLPAADVSQHLQQAADNANAAGQPDVAHEIGDLMSRAQSDPASIKTAAISYITSNPQVLAHFAPAFAQDILSKI
jgi:hypothetical protein